MKSFVSAILVGLSLNLHAQSVEITDLYRDEVAVEAFNLSRDATIQIEGLGAVFNEDWNTLVGYGWIVESSTRKVVWHLFDYMKDKNIDTGGEFEFSLDLDLKKGNYELYYTVARTNDNWNNDWNSWSVRSFDDVVDRIFDSRSSRKFRSGTMDDMYLRVRSSSISPSSMKDLMYEQVESAIISFNKVLDDQSFQKGFSLSDDTDIRIYALGEGRKKETFDYFWIYDAVTREPVFELTYDNTEFAGGAKKNLKFDEIVKLRKGSYIASYVSDDSHSYEKWNALPPDDPYFWGATIWPASEQDRRNVIPFKAPKTMSPVVDLTRIRDDETVSQGIRVKEIVDVRILCLGEGTSTMVDFGWILNANSREKVWKMRLHDTDHAGGAEKNRKISEVITLDKGDYIVYYTTDDSHSYNDWNSTQPHEPKMWGITLWATKDSDVSKIESFNPSEFRSKNSLAEILMVRDDEYIRESFTLDRDGDVRILALGEGSSGDMYDYGYIRDETGRTIWEMDYYDSDHAGGARKNREFNEKISLRKGTYSVTYRTDGSHSYGDWNASPPPNEEMWGILILKD